MIGLAFNKPQIPVRGLKLYLNPADKTSYPETGTTYTDITNNAYQGTLLNGTTWSETSGNDRGKFYFDGAGDNIVFGDILDMGTDSVTMCAWIRPFATDNINTHIMGKAQAGSFPVRYTMGILNNTLKLRAIFIPQIGTTISPYTTNNMTYNTFQLATMVFDRAGSIKIYFNDTEQSLTGAADISAWSATDFQNATTFRLAALTNSTNTAGQSEFNGWLGEMFWYNRVLSQTEITQIYNATKSKYGY